MPVRPHKPWQSLCLFALTLAGLVWLVLRGEERLGYSWHWRQIPGYFLKVVDGQWIAGPLLQGLGVTLEIVAWSLVLAGMIGLVTALLRLSGSRVGRGLARVYLESVRNTPLLVQIFFLYFVMAPIFDIGRTATAVLALSLFEGAYASEVFRAGIESVHPSQRAAARSLGLSYGQTLRHVVLPQAVRRVVPALMNDLVSLQKDSGLIAVLGVIDAIRAAQIETASDFNYTPYVVAGALFVCLTIPMARFTDWVARRQGFHGAGGHL